MQTRLHSVLSNNLMPPALRRPLRFGDAEQIKALYEVESLIRDLEAVCEEEGIPIEAVKQYRVEIVMEARHTVTVLAHNKAAAIEKAQEQYEDFQSWELDLDVDYHAREVKSR